METKVLKNEKEYLKSVLDIILDDEIFAFPTDTVYGLGANAMSEKAVEKIYKIKGRENTKALIIMTPQNYDLNSLCYLNENAKKLIKNFWPGPLTLILKSKKVIANNATAELDTIGVRIPDNTIALKILNSVNIPLVTTSANISKMPSPINANEVLTYFDNKLPLIIDGGECKEKSPSTIVDLSGENLKILREGPISLSDIKNCLNKN